MDLVKNKQFVLFLTMVPISNVILTVLRASMMIYEFIYSTKFYYELSTIIKCEIYLYKFILKILLSYRNF